MNTVRQVAALPLFFIAAALLLLGSGLTIVAIRFGGENNFKLSPVKKVFGGWDSETGI